MTQQISQTLAENSRRPTPLGQLFDHLPADASQRLEKITVVQQYPSRSVLFHEAHPASGIFRVRSGRVKLSLSSPEGKSRLVLQIAGPGEMLGLGSTLSGRPNEVTAEAMVPCEVLFVPRPRFLQFLREHPDVSTPLVKLLSQDLDGAYERVRVLRQR